MLLNWLNSIPTDKVAHFAVGVLVYAPLHFINPVIGLIGVAVAAVGKEVYDWFNKDKHTPEVLDAAVTLVGGVVGFICGI